MDERAKAIVLLFLIVALFSPFDIERAAARSPFDVLLGEWKRSTGSYEISVRAIDNGGNVSLSCGYWGRGG
jgi:hypothetical protein